MLRLCCVNIIVLLHLLEIHLTKCETVITGSTPSKSVLATKEILPHTEQTNNDINTLTERLTQLESYVAENKLNLENYQSEVKEEVKVLRNATLLLLTIVSGRGNDCQGVKDISSKIKILYAALAAYEPSLNFPKIGDEYSYSESEMTPSTEISTTFHKYDFKSKNLESRDLVLQSFNDLTTIKSTSADYKASESNEGILTSTEIYSSTTFPTTTTLETSTISSTTTSTSTIQQEKIKATKKQTKIYKYKTTHAPINCPRGSKLVGRECFSVHLDLQLNWTSARSFCRNIGGDLAEPNMGNDKLPRQLLKTWPAFKESSYWTLWVGATDQEKEGEWHWVTGGMLNLNGSPRWNVGEPADEGETQDCLAMILWVPGRWQRWDLLDDPCDLEWFIFCEYSP